MLKDTRTTENYTLSLREALPITLAARGKSLSQGMIVMTGSIVSTKFLNTGDTATVSIDGLGEARLTVT